MSLVKISQLISYPIKSCAGIQHQTVEINALGLAGDRQWMLVDDDGVFVSQRKFPTMALIQPQLYEQAMVIKAPGMEALQIDLTSFHMPIEIKVWKDSFQAQTLSESANQWFSQYLGVSVKLVQYTDISRRLIDQDFAQANQQVAFADGYPILITHETTLKQLNEQLSHPVNMSRFRPNIVVTSSQQAWDELNWSQLVTDSLHLNLVKPCARCVMTGVEQSSGEQTGTEVLKTLRHKFPHQEKAIFGINAIPEFISANSVELKLNTALEIN
jgi:uncharacterized protein YcbX